MGLSTKQVISDDHEQLDWSQTLLQSDPMEFPKPRRQQIHQQPQQEPLKCPRCDSTNTKFCYYNNYNKSQPRHFCKACKRHWTKGGTLRNVPVGGGRKNKRVKRSNSTSAANRRKKHTGIKIQPESQSFPLGFDDQKITTDPLYHSLLHDYSVGNNGNFFPVPQNQTLDFSFSSFSTFESSTRKPEEAMEDPIITTIMPNSSGIVCDQPWELVPTTSSVMEVPNDWNWNDLETMASADLNIPWDDTLIEP